MTDDDVCGYEGTTTGEPCQHPAGSCPVPSHADPDAENPHGRPSAYTDERARSAIEAAETGQSKTGCARAAGVDRATLDRWLEAEHTLDGDDFRAAFRRARNAGESTLIERGLYDPDTDSSMAKFLLASSFDYVKSEKREVTGEGGGGIIINTTAGDDGSDE